MKDIDLVIAALRSALRDLYKKSVDEASLREYVNYTARNNAKVELIKHIRELSYSDALRIARTNNPRVDAYLDAAEKFYFGKREDNIMGLREAKDWADLLFAAWEK